MQEMSTKIKNQNKDDSVASIASELMRDQIIDVVRNAEMKQLNVIRKYIDEDVLCDVMEYVKDKKTCETFDVIDNLDHEPKEICKVLDFLEVTGKIKFD